MRKKVAVQVVSPPSDAVLVGDGPSMKRAKSEPRFGGRAKAKITVWLPSETASALYTRCERDGRPLWSVVNDALREHLVKRR